MILLRLLGQIIFGLGLAVLAVDISTAFTGSEFRLLALGELWAWVHLDSLLLLQPAVERHISPVIWDPGVQTLLEWPASVEFLVIGAGLWHLGRA